MVEVLTQPAIVMCALVSCALLGYALVALGSPQPVSRTEAPEQDLPDFWMVVDPRTGDAADIFPGAQEAAARKYAADLDFDVEPYYRSKQNGG